MLPAGGGGAVDDEGSSDVVAASLLSFESSCSSFLVLMPWFPSLGLEELVSLAAATDDEEAWGAMVIQEGEDGETGPVLLADAPVLARLLFLLRSSSDGERERFLVSSVSGIVRQFQCYFLVFFLWICGMARGIWV